MKELTEKYRPITFDEVYGQDNSIKILRDLVCREDRPHTYLFSGEYGVGKTTLARIFLNELKCNSNDIIEINSANNRGIDTAREIIDSCDYYPWFGKIKAYIFDECHKFTIDYQNAMLKVLENPPDHVYFILCTTEANKLIKPVRSRCTELKLELVSIRNILKCLKNICKKEDKNISVKVLKQIAITSEGHVRDSIKLLEKIFDIENEDTALEIISCGLNEEKGIIDLCRALLRKNNWNEVKAILKNLQDDPEKIRYAVLGYMNSVLLNVDTIEKGRQASLVIEFFIDPFFNSGRAGLTSACFNIYL